MKKRLLSLSAIKKILRKAGSERISRKACLELQKNVEEYAIIIGKLAVRNALYEGRKSIKDRDIKEALKEIREE